MASVAIRDVRKAFAAIEVIHGVSVAIEDGEFVVLVGPSGCGKSTLLRMIAGLENITAGEIRIGERVVNRVPPRERDSAMVFQNYALYPHMAVAANMGFSLMLRGAPKAEIRHRVGRAADILGLGPLLGRFPRQLSGGQRQRVAMGRAIVRDPQVFLFDEPLSNLDAKLRVAMRTEIKELHQRRRWRRRGGAGGRADGLRTADRSQDRRRRHHRGVPRTPRLQTGRQDPAQTRSATGALVRRAERTTSQRMTTEEPAMTIF